MSIDYGSDESFISNYNKLKSAEKMGILYGVSKTSILNHAKKIGYNVRDSKNYKLSQEDKEEILRSYYYKTSGELAKEYNVSRGMITKLWYDNNLTGKEKSRKYYLGNPDYFKNIDTEEKAYFLGFIAADGCIYDTEDSRQTRVRIGISKVDKEILEKLQKELNTNKPINEFIKNNKEYSSLEISSQIIGDDLKKLGLVARKTYKKTWVELDSIFLQNAFIRGYFDGDGSITGKIQKNQLSKVHVTISGFKDNLEFFKRYLEFINISSTFIQDKRIEKYSISQPFGFLTFTSKENKYLFLDSIYPDNSSVYLTRKFNKALTYKNLYREESK